LLDEEIRFGILDDVLACQNKLGEEKAKHFAPIKNFPCGGVLVQILQTKSERRVG
jgi:hypothetical protein